MTLISNEIHMLNGFKKTLLIFAADRRLTYPDGSYAGTKQKLFPIPYLNGGVSYFGLAEVYPKSKKQYLSDWLREFVTRHSAATSLKDFAFRLRDELHTVIPADILSKNASGFHICGYNLNGLPEFWFLRNIGGMDQFRYTNLNPLPTSSIVMQSYWVGTVRTSLQFRIKALHIAMVTLEHK